MNTRSKNPILYPALQFQGIVRGPTGLGGRSRRNSEPTEPVEPVTLPESAHEKSNTSTHGSGQSSLPGSYSPIQQMEESLSRETSSTPKQDSNHFKEPRENLPTS